MCTVFIAALTTCPNSTQSTGLEIKEKSPDNTEVQFKKTGVFQQEQTEKKTCLFSGREETKYITLYCRRINSPLSHFCILDQYLRFPNFGLFYKN